MSATAAVRSEMEALEVEPGITQEQLAEQMFYLQMEVYSAHAGRDLYQFGDFERLSEKYKESWYASAKRKIESNAPLR